MRIGSGVEYTAGGRHQLSGLLGLLELDAGGEVGEVGDAAARELGHHVVPGQREQRGVGVWALHLVEGLIDANSHGSNQFLWIETKSDELRPSLID